MNRSTLYLIIATIGILAVYSLAQWQVQPQIDTRVGPIYPENPSYNFRTRNNYNPFQFNWYTGRFDYVPIPYDSAGSSNQNWQYSPPPSAPGVGGSVPQYVFGGPSASNSVPQPSAPSPNAVSPNIPSAPTPDDTTLWVPAPATQPSNAAPPSRSRLKAGSVASVPPTSWATQPPNCSCVSAPTPAPSAPSMSVKDSSSPKALSTPTPGVTSPPPACSANSMATSSSSPKKSPSEKPPSPSSAME